MEKYNKEFKKTFEKIELSSLSQEEIKKSIRARYKRHKLVRNTVISLLILLSVAVISTGTLYAGDPLGSETTRISRKYRSTNPDGSKFHKVKFESNVKKSINNDAELSSPTCGSIYPGKRGFLRDCYTLYTYDEIEDILGIRLIRSELFRGDKFALYFELRDEQNKISHLDFRIPNYYYQDERSFQKREEFAIDVSAVIRTEYSKKLSNTIFELNILETDEIIEYYLENLGVKAHIVTFFGNKETYSFFEYDNINYRIRVISNSTLGNDLIMDKTKEILDSVEK